MVFANVREIADAADVIVDGYAFGRMGDGYRVINLDTGNAAVFSSENDVTETTMDDIELAIARDTILANRQFIRG